MNESDSRPLKSSISSNWKFHGTVNDEVLLLGHSHTIAFWHAIDGLISIPIRISTIRPIQGYVAPDEFYWELARENSFQKTIVILWDGNQHNMRFLFKNTSSFTFAYENGFKELGSSSSPIIPTSLVREYFQSNGGLVGLKQAIKNFSPKNRVVVLGTPPPKSSDFITKLLSMDEKIAEIKILAGKDSDVNKIVPNHISLRFALWKVLQQETSKVVFDSGGEFIEVPKELYNEDGSLREYYNGEDVTHANSKYAVDFLQIIAAKLIEKKN